MKNRISEFRTQRGLTQQQLAQAVGVSRQTVISIESGKYNPSLLLAFAIAKAFACPIEELFIYEGAEK